MPWTVARAAVIAADRTSNDLIIVDPKYYVELANQKKFPTDYIGARYPIQERQKNKEVFLAWDYNFKRGHIASIAHVAIVGHVVRF
jgi:hypothetical protein